jgi:hypothetical protein
MQPLTTDLSSAGVTTLPSFSASSWATAALDANTLVVAPPTPGPPEPTAAPPAAPAPRGGCFRWERKRLLRVGACAKGEVLLASAAAMAGVVPLRGRRGLLAGLGADAAVAGPAPAAASAAPAPAPAGAAAALALAVFTFTGAGTGTGAAAAASAASAAHFSRCFLASLASLARLTCHSCCAPDSCVVRGFGGCAGFCCDDLCCGFFALPAAAAVPFVALAAGRPFGCCCCFCFGDCAGDDDATAAAGCCCCCCCFGARGCLAGAGVAGVAAAVVLLLGPLCDLRLDCGRRVGVSQRAAPLA